jgi:hypothetical protein
MHRMYYFSQVNIIAHGLLFHNQTELHVYYRKFYLCFRFNHYGSGSKKVPLQDVLSYALEFAQSKPEPHCLSLDSSCLIMKQEPMCYNVHLRKIVHSVHPYDPSYIPMLWVFNLI